MEAPSSGVFRFGLGFGRDSSSAAESSALRFPLAFVDLAGGTSSSSSLETSLSMILGMLCDISEGLIPGGRPLPSLRMALSLEVDVEALSVELLVAFETGLEVGAFFGAGASSMSDC